MGTKKELTPEILTEIVKELLATRDFCGNEREVLREWKHEYNITEKDECEIAEKVAQDWYAWRRAAGVI